MVHRMAVGRCRSRSVLQCSLAGLAPVVSLPSASDGVSLSRDPWVITSAGHAHVRVLASLAADLWLHPDSEAVGSARLVASMRLLRDGRGPVAP